MLEYKRILDYVIEQADRNDAKCLQFEQDIIFNIERSKDSVFSRMITRGSGCENLTDMQNLLTIMQTMMQIFVYESKRALEDKFSEYYNVGFKNTDQLLDVGLDVERKFSRNIKEISIVRDEGTIKYIQEHSFDMLTGYSNDIIQQLRFALGDLILKKSADRASVQKLIEKVLNTNPSKAKEIAQTELSRAYNYGVLARLSAYEIETGTRVRKYWHGFQYSPKTCTYCHDRIGNIYDLHDDSEQLPAHPRCRCVWLPVLDGWDKPINTGMLARANMLTTGYSEEQIYSRINNRLGINYGDYLKLEDAVEYLEGNRTPSMISKIANAREQAIDVTKDSFQIQSETGSDAWSKKFNQQMNFWKNTVAEAIVDNDKDMLNKCYDGIKAVIVLPWSSSQISKWEKLLYSIDEARS